MYKIDYNIFELYFQKELSYDEFVCKLVDYYECSEENILKELQDSYSKKNSNNIDYLIYTLLILDEVIRDFDLYKYSYVLNNLLISNWHNKHEDLIMLLEKINVLDSLDYLYKAIHLKLDYLSWDENYSFEKKCIYAIAKIGKQDALPYLKKLCCDNNDILCEYSEKLIEKIQIITHPQKEIRAVFDSKTIRVYQAFNILIASEAVRLGTFGSNFKMDRMSWIKPSFLWMMYRSGWASKENQERILAIDVKREGFDYIMNNAVDSNYQENKYGSKTYWRYKLQHANIICQWDPERDIHGNPLEHRSVQLGLRGDILNKYVNEWIVSINDITEYVLYLRELKNMKQNIDDLLPKEIVYDINKNSNSLSALKRLE